MSESFGEILDEWERTTSTPYGRKKINKNKRNNIKITQTIKKENEKTMNPIDLWLRKYGVENKDEKIHHEIDNACLRKKIKALKPQSEIDLHGMTCEEAEAALNVFFENSKRNGLKKILIIHGKGNHSSYGSVLAPFVQSYLEKQKYAGERGRSKNADGGAGATWVILK